MVPNWNSPVPNGSLILHMSDWLKQHMIQLICLHVCEHEQILNRTHVNRRSLKEWSKVNSPLFGPLTGTVLGLVLCEYFMPCNLFKDELLPTTLPPADSFQVLLNGASI